MKNLWKFYHEKKLKTLEKERPNEMEMAEKTSKERKEKEKAA